MNISADDTMILMHTYKSSAASSTILLAALSALLSTNFTCIHAYVIAGLHEPHYSQQQQQQQQYEQYDNYDQQHEHYDAHSQQQQHYNEQQQYSDEPQPLTDPAVVWDASQHSHLTYSDDGGSLSASANGNYNGNSNSILHDSSMHKNVSYLNGSYNSGYGNDGYARPGQVNRDMNRDGNRELLQKSGHSAVSATGGSSSAGNRSFGNANSGSHSHSNSQQQQQQQQQLTRQASTADYGHYTEASFDESQLHLDVTAAAAAALDNSADYSDHHTTSSSSRNAYAHQQQQQPQQQHEQLRGWNEDPHELQQLEVRNHQLQLDELPHSTAAPHTAAHHANHQHANHHAAQYHTTAAAAAANSPRVRGSSVDSTLDPWLVASPRRVPGGTPKHFHKGFTPQNKVHRPLCMHYLLL
jgi:hypothetical protein